MGPQPWELRKQGDPCAIPLTRPAASMGPQPWELRKPSALALDIGGGSIASMGPQPWELRKLSHLRSCYFPCEASMGPQPWELRKLRTNRTLKAHQQRFNGAAALGAAETPRDRWTHR